MNSSDFEIVNVNYEAPPNWCTLQYFELAQQIGPLFDFASPLVYIDGYCHPDSAERLSLGLLSNVGRAPEVQRTRQEIGRGVRLYYVREIEQVYLECVSNQAVFVQSSIGNVSHDLHPATVCKVPSTMTFMIYDFNMFRLQLQKAVQERHSFEQLYMLTQLCHIRLSFVKGWGQNYTRQSIHQTPCWIDIKMNGPLMWLDRVLRIMGPPTHEVSSIS